MHTESTEYKLAPDQVTIVAIRYGRLVNSGNYEHEGLELEALVRPEQNPAHVLATLKATAEDELGITLANLISEISGEFERLRFGYSVGQVRQLITDISGASDFREIKDLETARRLLNELKKREPLTATPSIESIEIPF